jgi:crotonobetainyl-CoA:carnitine CoA-transferase CaiB-like acyl-CoA transferase
MIGRPEWVHDERYDSLAKRNKNTVALTAEISRLFGERDLAHWAAKLDEHGLIWAPVATLPDVISDPQAREMGWFTTIDHPTLGTFETLDTPFRIYGADVGARGPAPAPGEHTFEVLAELGIDGDELARLATEGVIG